MPKVAKESTISRQWKMLMILPERGTGLTTREITEKLKVDGFHVSLRTIERDLNDLSQLFSLVDEDDATRRGKRWKFALGKAPDFGSVDLVDAVSLGLAGDLLEGLLPVVMMESILPKINQARTKLKSLHNLPIARWSQKVRYVPNTLSFQPPRITRKRLEAVQKALIEELQIEVKYEPFQQKQKMLRLHPLCFVMRGNIPYLVATIFDYQDIRLFALHRFRSVTLLAHKITYPKDFDIDEYLASGGMEFTSFKKIKLKARLSEELATYLSETPISEDQRIRYINDQWQLNATVTDSWQLQFWILSQGPAITILNPKSLRERIYSNLLSAVSNYTKI